MKRWVKWLSNIVLVVAALAAIFGLLLPSLFSSRLVIVYSSSMEPALPVGSLAVITPVEPTSIQVGNIIAFSRGGEEDAIIAHRVVEVVDAESLSFRTKGDANDFPDRGVTPARDLVGEITWHVSHAGYGVDRINDFVRTMWGLLFLVCLPSLVIVVDTVQHIYRPPSRKQKRLDLLRKRQRRRRR